MSIGSAIIVRGRTIGLTPHYGTSQKRGEERPLIILAFFIAHSSFIRRFPQALPSISFWLMIKSIAWAMNWFLLLIPRLTFPSGGTEDGW